jgi:hypothetical protein
MAGAESRLRAGRLKRRVLARKRLHLQLPAGGEQLRRGEHRSRWFQPKDFQFDPQTKTCLCPAGNTLKLSTANAVIKGRRGISFEGTKARCQGCPLRTQCLRKPDISPYRQVPSSTAAKPKTYTRKPPR